MAESPKSHDERSAELRAVIEHLKTELAKLQRLREEADKVNMELDKALELRRRVIKKAD